MKQFFFFSFLLALTISSEAKNIIVRQTICYSNENASEIYLVWGVNDWQKLPKSQWPEGSFEKQGLVYTPMPRHHNTFLATIQVEQGTKLDYVFWITKGPFNVDCDVWDVNRKPHKDYHVVAMNDNTVITVSDVKIKSTQQLSLLHFARLLFSLAAFALIIVFLLRKNYFQSIHDPRPVTIIAATSFVALLFCTLARASSSGLGWELYYDTLSVLPTVLHASFSDYFLIVLTGVLFSGLALVLQRFVRIQKIVLLFFVVVSVVCVSSSILHIRVMEILGKPFNLRWLYYSDFLQSSDAKSAASFNLPPAFVTNFVLLFVAAIMGSIAIIYCMQFIMHTRYAKRIIFSVFILFNASYIALANTSDVSLPSHKTINPVLAFLSSINTAEGYEGLYSMNVPDSLKFESKSSQTSKEKLPHTNIKNVLVMVLESTPAEYVQPYANRYKVTPVLAEQLNHAIVFDRVYAHAPATNKSLVSLLASSYPWLSYHSITNEHPEVSMHTVSEELHRAGYRTAFFNAGDNRFQKSGEFLAHRGFDVVRDCHSLECETHFSETTKNWGPLDGINDACAADKLLEWAGMDTSKNFFAVFWTYQTHYPYYSSTRTVFEPYDTTLNRYLNAVHHSDAVLGDIIRGLGASGKLNETLIVVVGDHGEAFGRHDQTTHASKIYEENVHIPCVFINPQFAETHYASLGGTVDIAPTIMHLLGKTPANEWQGQSLFAKNRHPRTYFFCPWSDYLYGYREGDIKFIYNASTDSCEMYDLRNDPYEKRNIATADNISLNKMKLASWVQYQHKHMQNLLDAQ